MDPASRTGGGTDSGNEEDLAAEIAHALATDGSYVMRLTQRPTQQLVDLHWTAHRAGRMLGIKVRVVVEGPRRHGDLDPWITVTISPRRHDRWLVHRH